MIQPLHLLGFLGQASPASSSGCTIAPGGFRVDGFCTDPGSLHIPVAYRSIIPVLVLTIGALVMLALSAVLPKRARPGLWPALTALVGAFSLAGAVWQWYDLGTAGAAQPTIGGQIFYDRFSVLFLILISIAVIFGALSADSYLRREGLDGIEAYILMLMSAIGAMLMAQSGSLIMLFLGLEIMSIALYVMAAYHRRRTQSGEAGLKYFILGSFSSALFLYGVALIYGATGSVEFGLIGNFLTGNVIANNGVLLGGMALVIVGLGFKVAAVPFHYWTPDVYQGSPTPFTGYMAAVAKAAGFAGLFRVLTQALGTQQANWRPIIWLMAVLTLGIGSVMAIAQKDLKRMMAYSSISQAGYVLVGLQAASATGTSGALFYLFTYIFVIVGTFAVIGLLQGRGEARSDLGVIRGLGRRQPLLAGVMLVFLLAQAGVPFTSGFLAKFYVIQAAVQRGQYWLAVIAMLAAAIAAFFYLRIALLMYSSDPAEPGPLPVDVPPADAGVLTLGLEPIASLDLETTLVIDPPSRGPVPVPLAVGAVLAVSAAFTIAAGVSSFAIDFAKQATTLF
ncbi:MAG: NADH-quinone oxidoreductase subunit N [Acidimicrobiales bacterium]|nr:NADH-quinone oxidoreductase subunit N [Acidimicrobiales bacterium]